MYREGGGSFSLRARKVGIESTSPALTAEVRLTLGPIGSIHGLVLGNLFQSSVERVAYYGAGC